MLGETATEIARALNMFPASSSTHGGSVGGRGGSTTGPAKTDAVDNSAMRIPSAANMYLGVIVLVGFDRPQFGVGF